MIDNKMYKEFDKTYSRYGTYSTQWDYVKDRFGESNLLPFTISDMDFRVAKSISDRLDNAVKKGFFGYTRWNHSDFKKVISDWFTNQYNAPINEDDVVYSPSVIFSLAKLLELFSNENDTVVTLSPCYDAFIDTVPENKRKLIQLPIGNNRGDLLINEMRKSFEKYSPKIFLLCNPHNPTGIQWSKGELEGIVKLCNDYEVNIISDEIHMDVHRKNTVPISLMNLSKIIKTDFSVITSISKSFNAPSLGCTYAIIPSKKVKNQFLKILKQKNGLSSVPYLGLLGTIEAYTSGAEWLETMNQYLDDNFLYLKERLSKMGIDYEIQDATYLAWIDISQLNIKMTDLQKELVHNQKVAIMDGTVYGVGGENHLRMNIGAPRNKIKDGLDRLEKAILNLKE